MPISSFVLSCDNSNLAALKCTLSAMPEVEVGDPINGRLPVVVDTYTRQDDRRVISTLESLETITHIQLIFAHFADLEQEPM